MKIKFLKCTSNSSVIIYKQTGKIKGYLIWRSMSKCNSRRRINLGYV